MRILPSQHHPRVNTVSKQPAHQVSFKRITFEPYPEAVQNIYKNGPEIFETLYTELKKIEKKFHNVFDFKVAVDGSMEPRVCKFTVSTKSEADVMPIIRDIAENGQNENIYPKFVKTCQALCDDEKYGNLDDKTSEKYWKSTGFLFKEFPFADVFYAPYGDPEKKKEFIERLHKIFSYKTLIDFAVYANGSKSDIKPTFFERIF